MNGVVIVGYEGSDRSKDALGFGEALATTLDVRLVVACIHPLQPRSSTIGAAGSDREVRAGAQRTAESARELLVRVEEAEFCAALGLSAADGLADLARERDASAVVVGSSDRGAIGRVFPGSVARRLVRGAPCAVAVAPAGYARERRASLSSVGAAFDGSPAGERALHVAERLAARFRGRLLVIAVSERDSQADALSSLLGEAVVAAPVSARAEGALRRGDPARELALASAALDVLVCGSRGNGPLRDGPLRELVRGSVSVELMSRARCPIMILPRSHEL